MILVTTDEIPDKKIIQSLGLVKGNTVRARHIGRDIIASLKNIVGGEVQEYTKLLAEAREQAIDRMIQEAKLMGADGIVGLRFTTSSTMQGVCEILVYGTAVKIIPKE